MALHDHGGEEIMQFLAKFLRDGNWIFAAQLPDGIAVGNIVDFSEIATDVGRLVFSTAEREEVSADHTLGACTSDRRVSDTRIASLHESAERLWTGWPRYLGRTL